MKKRLIIIVCIVILFIENLPEGIITSAIEKSIVGKNEKICSNYNNKIINNYFKQKNKDLSILEEYSKIFKVHEKFEHIMEVLI